MSGSTILLAKILFVDYGYVHNVQVCDLRELHGYQWISSIPGLAFECVLAEIRPAALSNITGQWSPGAIEEFRKLIGGDVSLFGEVYSVVSSIVNLKLIRVDGKEQMDINQALINLGYAEKKEEDYLSRCNREFREMYDKLPLKIREHHEELQYDQGYMSDSYPDPPEAKDCSSVVRLRGPRSPLEIDLISLTKSGVGKHVTIDHASVNSVLLDTNHDDPHDRLIVAGSVHQSPSGHNLSLRNTTLMPNIPGLTSLMCLIFAPRMELRRNATGRRYTGALCGLGYHPVTKESLFPEHDLSIYFDVDIGIDDLQDVSIEISLSVFLTLQFLYIKKLIIFLFAMGTNII